MKNKFLIMTFIIVVSFCIMGCGTREDKTSGDFISDNPNNKIKIIPFLTYHRESEGTIKAKISQWDLEKGEIHLAEKDAYFINKPKNDYINNYIWPLSWDGKSQFIIRKDNTISKNFYATSEIIDESTPYNTCIFGDNIKVIINKGDNDVFKNYKLVAYDGKNTIEKEVNFTYKFKDDNGQVSVINDDVSLVSFLENQAVFIFAHYFNSGIRMFVARHNIKNGETKWSVIKIPKDVSIAWPAPNNTIQIGNKIFIQSEGGIGCIDLKENRFEYLKSISDESKNVVNSTMKNEFHPDLIKPIGKYHDILVIGVPVRTGGKFEYLWCAYRENEFLGAIYFKDNMFKVFNKNKNISSKLDVEEKNLYNLICFPTTFGYY